MVSIFRVIEYRELEVGKYKELEIYVIAKNVKEAYDIVLGEVKDENVEIKHINHICPISQTPNDKYTVINKEEYKKLIIRIAENND